MFRCPEGHLVDGNPGRQFPIAVVGLSGASKSHFLAAVVRELGDLRRLRPLGIAIRRGLYTSSQLSDDSAEVYVSGHVLERTPVESGVSGPHGFRVEAPALEERFTLLLSDVAGEHFSDIMRIAASAHYMLLSEAIIVLLDPSGFLPSKFDENTPGEHERLTSAIEVRKSVQAIIETLAHAWGKEPSELEVPFCFTVAKADAVFWHDFDWSGETERVLAEAKEGSLDDALLSSSARVRQALAAIGGEMVIDEIDDLLDSSYVRFSAASASSTMATPAQKWEEHPTPNGVALTVLQVLNCSDIIAASPARSE
jgi:hypothetical protein